VPGDRDTQCDKSLVAKELSEVTHLRRRRYTAQSEAWCNGTLGMPVSSRVMGARSQHGQMHFGTIRLALCEERVRPSQGDDITSFWSDVTCRQCVTVACQRLWDYAFPDLLQVAKRLKIPVPERRPSEPTWAEFVAADSAKNDADTNHVPRVRP
jgi:hypothetical protein